MRTLLFAWFALQFALSLAGQSASFTLAAEVFEAGEYARCLELLDEIERDRGKTPRTESLRAWTFHEMGRAPEAYRSLKRYAALTRSNPNLADHAGHRELLRMLAEYENRLRAEKAEAERRLRAEREEAAQRMASAAEAESERRVGVAARRFEEKFAAMTPAQLAQLDEREFVWLKAAAPQVLEGRIDERVFRIAELDGGTFRLGMSRTEFEEIIYRRLRAFETDDPVLQRVIAAFRLPETGKVRLGFVFPVKETWGEAAWVTTGSLVEDLALGMDDFVHENRAEAGYLRLLQAMTAAHQPLLERLAGGEGPVHLVAATFGESGMVTNLTFAATLPAGERDPAPVLGRLQAYFGPLHSFPGAGSDRLIRFRADRGELRGGAFAFPAAAGRALTGRVVQREEPFLEVPYTLEVKLSALEAGSGIGDLAPVDGIDFRPGERAFLARRVAVQALNRHQRRANGQGFVLNGRDGTLVLGPRAFSLEGREGRQTFGFRDQESGTVLEVVYAGIALSTLEAMERTRQWGRGADFWSLQLGEPCSMQVDGREVEQARAVPLFTESTRGLDRLVVASLPPEPELSVEIALNLSGTLFSRGGVSNSFFYSLLKTKDARGEVVDLYRLAHLARWAEDDGERWLEHYLRRAAEQGDESAIVELAEILFTRSDTGAPRLTDEQRAVRADARRWVERAAEIGSRKDLQRMVTLWAYDDYLQAESWLDRWEREWRERYFDVDLEILTRRASLLRSFQNKSFEERLRAYRPDLSDTYIGRPISEVTANGREAVAVREEPGTRTRRKITVYEVREEGRVVRELRVNRRGVILGERLRLARHGDYSYPAQVAQLRQLFGDGQVRNVTRDYVGILEAFEVRLDRVKTIRMTLIDAGEAHLLYIDHTLE